MASTTGEEAYHCPKKEDKERPARDWLNLVQFQGMVEGLQSSRNQILAEILLQIAKKLRNRFKVVTVPLLKIEGKMYQKTSFSVLFRSKGWFCRLETRTQRLGDMEEMSLEIEP